MRTGTDTSSDSLTGKPIGKILGGHLLITCFLILIDISGQAILQKLFVQGTAPSAIVSGLFFVSFAIAVGLLLGSARRADGKTLLPLWLIVIASVLGACFYYTRVWLPGFGVSFNWQDMFSF